MVFAFLLACLTLMLHCTYWAHYRAHPFHDVVILCSKLHVSWMVPPPPHPPPLYPLPLAIKYSHHTTNTMLCAS